MKQNEQRVVNDKVQRMCSGQEGNRYIEGEERLTRTYQAREVCDQALPDHSCKTNETSGVDLMQKEGRLNNIRSGVSVDVGNWLDARKREG